MVENRQLGNGPVLLRPEDIKVKHELSTSHPIFIYCNVWFTCFKLSNDWTGSHIYMQTALYALVSG